jgi:SAM-dependent methyltransferase
MKVAVTVISRVDPGFVHLWTKLAKIRRSIRRRGVKATLEYLREAFDIWLSDRYLDRRFDKKFHVDTVGAIELPERLQNGPVYREAEPYEQSPVRLVNRMIDSLNIDCSTFVFTDLGCGKGKALLLAAKRPFRRVVGVDLSPELLRIAADNFSAYRKMRLRCGEIELRCMSAIDLSLPADNLVLFFYNPFSATVMRAVLENLRASLIQERREVYLLYIDPVHEHLFVESGFLKPVRQGFRSCIYKAVPFGGPQEFGLCRKATQH